MARVIGLLGGSFNPAHEGHLHISRYALDKLHMDEVWWLVSPHNPLKDKNTLADYEQRLASAQRVGKYPRIRILDFERRHKLQYTFKTLQMLKRKYPQHQFVWLMGADNLAGFHRWQRWKDILHMLPVVVFDRAPHIYTALTGQAAHYMHKFMLKNNVINRRWDTPSLAFIRLRRNSTSATDIRKTLGKPGGLGHNKGKELT